MTCSQLFQDLARQIEARALPGPLPNASLRLLEAEAQKPAYFRDAEKIKTQWRIVREFGVRHGLFQKYAGDDDSRRNLAVFLNTSVPKKGKRDLKWQGKSAGQA